MLQECRRRRRKIRRLNENIAKLRSEMESTTKALSFAPPGGGGQQDKLGEQICSFIELINQKANQVLALESLKNKVEKWASTLPEQQGLIVCLRYVDGLPWKKVAKESSYSEDHCYTIHRAALRKCTDWKR